MKKSIQTQIENIFKKHFKEFCLLSYSYVFCKDTAQDIVQDVFVQILSSDDAFKIVNLKGYIWKSVKYSSLKHLKNSVKFVDINEDFYLSSIPERRNYKYKFGTQTYGVNRQITETL